MDNQNYMPSSSGPFSSTPGGSASKGPLLMVLLVVLGLGTVIFGALTVTFSSKAATTAKNASAQAATAAAKARNDQKKLDETASTRAAESPFRSYTAPEEFGSFVINFPKTWSSTIDQEPSGTQVQLILNPDFIRRTSGQDAPIATRVVFLEKPKDQYLATFANNIKKGTLKQTTTTVSGQPAYDLVGTFSDHKTVHMVVVPVRDKVLVFSSENSSYATEFNEIVAQAKIIP